MSVFACGCAANTKARRARKSLHNDLYMYKKKYRFADDEFLEFRQRFNFLANTKGEIDKPNFFESMGVLGLDSGSFLSERIFHVVDKDQNGFITLDEYLCYFDILIYGTQEEKYELTFRLIDIERKSFFTYEEFYEMIMSMLHAWNNITGHHYNIQQNTKLNLFLEDVFRKFNSEKTNRVTLESFKAAVSKEPELLEIFDYFNEGIVDAINSNSQQENQNLECIQELEQLYSKISHLRTLLKGKNCHEEHLPSSMHKERSPRTSQIPVSSVFQVHKPEELRLSSPNMLTSPQEERRGSVLQHSLDNKIRRTILFEHLREGSMEEDLPIASLARPRSEVIRFEGSRKNLQVHRRETADLLKKSDSSDKAPNRLLTVQYPSYARGDFERVNTLDGMLDTSPKIEEKGRKRSIFANKQGSPEEHHHTRSPGSTSSVNPQDIKLDVSPIKHVPSEFGKFENNILRIRSHQEERRKDDEASPHFSRHASMEPSSFKNNLQVIREEKTIEELFKPSDAKSSRNLSGSPNPRLKLSGDPFLGVLLNSQRKEKADFVSRVPEKISQSENPVKITKDHSSFDGEDQDLDDNQGLRHFRNQRPNTIMIEPKALDSEEVDLSSSKVRIDTAGSNHGKHAFRLDDVKLSDSLVVPSLFSGYYQPGGNSKDYDNNKSPQNGSPHLKLNNEGINFKKFSDYPEDERYQQISQQVDLIADETLRIIDIMHKKKRSINKKENNKDDKKVEMMREMTTHNIPKTTKDKEKAKQGNFVSFGHQNWNLVLNMMLGIQKAVNSAAARPETLSFKDFNIKYVFELITKRTSETKDNYKICKFFDYAPSIFHELRRLFGIKNEDYLKSIGPESMLNGLIKGNLSTLAELTSSGKSGSFFYYSADGKYTLKTISREEFHFLRKILNNYYTHIMNNPNTLIIKFYGLHKVRFMKSSRQKKKLYFVIMANVFHTNKEIHVRYDLKGSTQGRITKDDDPSIAKKDLNILQEKEKIVLSSDVAEVFTQIVEKDSKFFAENHIIDYSLLLGIHRLEQEEMSTKDISLKKPITEFKLHGREGVPSGDGSKIYFFGIIDILTEFNARKRSEYMVKKLVYGNGISAIPPQNYSNRFLKFIKGLVETV